jgi:exopolyphosphatase / guanosine-5'-triphosphate,3'-diphosphate pyrophosphatase
LRQRWSKNRNRNRSRRRRNLPVIAEFAAIDLGTNSCRMLIVHPTASTQTSGTDNRANYEFTVVDGFSRIVRLGEGIGETGNLSQAAMDRTIEALSICADKITQRRVEHIHCIATEACRRATNSDAFIERVLRETGLKLDIISPEREAELTLSGCAPLLNTGHNRALLFDIGGGSTEVQWVKIPPLQGDHNLPQALDVLSLPIGVVTLLERFGADAMTAENHHAIIQEIEPELKAFSERNGIEAHITEGRVQMLGTSGTVTTLGAMHLDLPRYDRSRIDGLTIDFSSIQAISAHLSGLSVTERRNISCIGPGRADLMLMGCALLSGFCRCWPVGKLRIADRGIREGLLVEMIKSHYNSNPGSGPSSGSGASHDARRDPPNAELPVAAVI